MIYYCRSSGEADAPDQHCNDARRPIRTLGYELVLVQQDIQGDDEDTQEGVKKIGFSRGVDERLSVRFTGCEYLRGGERDRSALIMVV